MGAFKSDGLFTSEDRSPAARTDEDAPLPERVGGYAPICRLGRGGTSDVYLGLSVGSESDFRKLVVLKLLQPELRRDPYSAEMFRREARIAARLSHPNTVQTFAIEETDDCSVLVMEYLEGAPLGAVLRCAARDPEREHLGPLLGAVAQALSGLHYVHELSDFDGECLQLVHRDIKPGNIFITYDGDVKVLDFGIAKVSAQARDATTSTYLKGTAQYMAPELINDVAAVDRRSDIFSMGVVLWELAHGRRLWGSKTNGEIFRGLVMGDLPLGRPGEHPDVAPQLDRLCRRAMSIAPQDRHQTAEEMRQDVLTVLEELRLDHGRERLASLMETWFGAARRRRASEISERIATLAPGRAPTTLPPVDSPSMPGGSVASGSAMSATLATPRGPSRSVWLPLLAALTLSMGGVAAWVASRAAPVASAPAPGENVVVRISAQPTHAEILLDGVRLDGNPVHLERPIDDAPHTLVVRASGYEQRYLELRLDRSRDIDLTLLPQTTEPRQAPVAAVAAPVAAASTAVPRVAGSDDADIEILTEETTRRPVRPARPRPSSAAATAKAPEPEAAPPPATKPAAPTMPRLSEGAAGSDASNSRFAPLQRRDLKPFQVQNP